jgi:hypothetical protein
VKTWRNELDVVPKNNPKMVKGGDLLALTAADRFLHMAAMTSEFKLVTPFVYIGLKGGHKVKEVSHLVGINKYFRSNPENPPSPPSDFVEEWGRLGIAEGLSNHISQDIESYRKHYKSILYPSLKNFSE